MYRPDRHDEATSLVRYVDQQLAAIRAAVHGLTEDQASARPCRSALSVIGIIKHTADGMRGATRNLREGMRTGPLTESDFSRYLSSFALVDGETARDVLQEFDAARAEYLAAIGDADPDSETVAAPAPWEGINEPTPILLRYYLMHQVEEMARHAGHADIIREQLDGVSVPTLVMTLEGVPANPFFQPYEAAPGTLAG